MEITKDILINELLRKHPESRAVFNKHNMGCVGCMGAASESIEKGALMHGLDIKMVLADLKALGNKEPGNKYP